MPKIVRPITTILFVLLAMPPISRGQKSAPEKTAAPTAVQSIEGIDHLNRIVEKAGDRLLVFDLYADWCVPCKYLTPMLEEIAREHGDKASFYKVDVDRHSAIAAAFGVSGIPYVVFVKEQKGVHAITGLQPKAAYVRAIEELAKASGGAADGTVPDGELVDGVRVVTLKALTNPNQIVVYRGETVTLLFDSLAFAYSVHIPQFDVSQGAEKGQRLEVTFKADETGVFPMYCNGDCPQGDGAQLAQIVVMRYEGEGDNGFGELDAQEAAELIKSTGALLLDVRTPREYYAQHIEGATLIPLQQLAGRLSEIEAHKNKPILIYCRSGNRSTVAAEILGRNGFTKLYHLRDGIKGWVSAGHKTVKE